MVSSKKEYAASKYLCTVGKWNLGNFHKFIEESTNNTTNIELFTIHTEFDGNLNLDLSSEAFQINAEANFTPI